MEPAGKDDESADPDEAVVGVDDEALAALLQALRISAATIKTTNSELYFLSILFFSFSFYIHIFQGYYGLFNNPA